jgi:lysozyme
MQVSANGIKLVMNAEGFRSRVYLDVAGNPTIGYGHKLLHPDSFPNGVDETTAQHMLACDLDDVESDIPRLVKVPLTQGQFDALADFVFNLGATRLQGSTLLSLLNSSQYDQAAQQLLRWDHADIKGSEVELADLKSRRQAEFTLWHFVAPNDPAAAAEVAA